MSRAAAITCARVTATLAIGTVGGLIGVRIGLPMPYILGPLVVVAACAIAELKVARQTVHVPRWVRTLMMPVLGVLLGASFTPQVVAQMGEWWVTIVALAVLLIVGITAVYLIYLHWFGLDRPTAFFAASPGGLLEMTLAGEAVGGKSQTIALIHFCRIVLAVSILPFILQVIHGPVGQTAAMLGATATPIGPLDVVILTICAIAGYYLARAVRLPGAAMVGPILLSAVAHATGLTHASPPPLLVIAAQIATGSALGVGFVGLSIAAVRTAMAAAGVAFVVMMGITFGLALLTVNFVDEPFGAIVLAFAPGGVAEMSLIALAANISIAFVTTHHVMRVFLALTFMPIFYRLVLAPRHGSEAEDGEIGPAAEGGAGPPQQESR